MNHHMYKIYEELSKRGISLESIQYGDYQRSELISEIQENINSWEYNVLELLDINNWNLKNLILEKPDHFIRGNIPYESNIRKPKAYFGLLITGKGNLALDWFPYDMTSFRMPIEKTDWLHWDNTWPRGSGDLPFNRVLMIRGFANLLNPPKNKPYPKLDQLIIEAIKDLMERIYFFLNRFIEIEKLTDLYLKYEGERFKKLALIELLNPKDVEKENAVRQKEAWIENTCEEFGISPQRVLEEFKANGLKYAPTARKLSSKSATLNPARLKKLIRLIYDFPELYDSFFEQPPVGVEPRKKKGQIIKVDFVSDNPL